MTCGCTDNKKLNNNKRLDNDNKLSLESMQSLSIDEIISLYRQGYVLEGLESTIETMSVAYANVVDVAGYYDTSLGQSWIAALFTNSGSCGWIRHVAVGESGYVAEFGNKQQCFPSSTTDLLYKAWYSTSNIVNIAHVEMYTCDMTSSDNCYQLGCVPGATAVCTGASTRTAISAGVGLPSYDPAVPSSPTNVTVTPGNGQLTLSWTPASFTDNAGQGIFSYFLEVYDPLTPGSGYDGHILGNATSFTFQNLTNGTQYTCTITAKSRSDTQSTIATITGTPTGPITGTIHFAITTSDASPKNGFEIYLDGSPTSSGTTDTNGIFDATVTGSPSPGTSHTYRIHKTNYTDQTGSVLVISGQISNVSKIMQSTVQACTAITLQAVPSSGTIGITTINLTATTTPAIAGFSIAFKDSTTTLNTGTTNSSGVATYAWNTTGQTVGTHNLTAVGTPGPCTSSIVPVSLTAPAQNCTAITLQAVPSSGIIGATINLTATTTPAIAGFNVVFKDGTTTLTTVATNSSGIATYAWGTSGQTVGTHNLTAVGTPGPCTSSIVPVSLTAPAQPCVAISLVTNPISLEKGQSTTLTATVTNPPNTAGYNVDFKVDGSLVATRATNSSGVATYSLNTSSLTIASHNIIASIGSPAQCTSSTVAIDVTTPTVQAGSGGAIMIAAVAAIGIAYFMMKKPPTKP